MEKERNRKAMIKATIYNPLVGHSRIIIFDTYIQSQVEDMLGLLGYGCTDYYLEIC